MYKRLLKIILFFTFFVVEGRAAIFHTPCVDELTGTSNGCTANDIGVQDISIIYVDDGCVNGFDTARVKMEVTFSAANAKRYDLGAFINIDGGSSAVTATGSQCLEEALYPVTTVSGDVNNSDPFGPYLDNGDGDLTGDVVSGDVVVRKITEGDLLDANNTTEAIFSIACADNDGNGYVDFAWAVSYGQQKNAVTANTTITEVVPGAKSKCTSGVSDTKDTNASIAIGVPDLSVSISCTPTSVDEGDVSTCTVTYTNSSLLVPADYIKFKINYPEVNYLTGTNGEGGTVGNIVTSGGESATDNGSEIIWTMSGGQTSGNIGINTTNSMTFDYTYAGGPNFDITVDTYYDDGVNTESDQGLSDTQSFTTLPVTLSYVYPEKIGDSLNVSFSTSSESGNIGFNLYSIKGKEWTKLNDRLIEGSLDSVEPRDYRVEVSIPSNVKVKKIGIAGVDANGHEDRHGGFKVGKESGNKIKRSKINWKKVNVEVKNEKKIRKAKRKAQKKLLKNQIINLEVAKDGVYRVTHDELMEQSINLEGQKIKNIAISFKNKAIARFIDGADKKGRWTKNSSLTFIGKAPHGSDALYLTKNYYQLMLKKKRVIESDFIEPLMEDVSVVEQNNRYSYSLPQEDPFYDGYFYSLGRGASSTLSRTFDMPKLEEGTSILKIDLSAYSDGEHELIISLNGTEIQRESTLGHVAWSINLNVDNTLLVEGSNTLTLTIPNRDGIFDYLVYDKLTVLYNDGIKNDMITPSINVYEKKSKKDILPKRGVNYVMITHPLFLGESLNRYVEQRTQEGWSIKVVNVEDIYASYSFGMEIPDAIKRYLKDVKSKKVTHVQLIGASTYDYHNYLGTGAMSLIPSMYLPTNRIIHYTPSDTALVLNKKGLPSLSIGRWPVRTVEDLERVINKTLAWDSMGQSTVHSTLFIADETNRGMDFSRQMNELSLLFSKHNWTDLTHVHLDSLLTENENNMNTALAIARTEIKSAFEKGSTITTYSGHSSPSLWSFRGLLKEGDITHFSNIGKTTIALPLACFTTYADSPYTNTLAHQLLVEGENGAVAIYGAGTTSSYGDNGLSAKKVINNLLNGKDIGTAIKDMKKSLGIRYNNTNINGQLLGDVTLKLK